MKKFSDNRGVLLFPISINTFNFHQCTVSINNLNVFRGVHVNPFDKLITCIKGKILDIIINLDITSDDYLIPKYYTLDPLTDIFQVLVPKHFGHAFLALENESIIVYHFNGTFKDETTKHINYLDPLLHIKLPVVPIVSIKDELPNFIAPIEFVIFGCNGFLGTHLVNILEQKKKVFLKSTIRLNNIHEIESLLSRVKPTYVINCAGLTGVPNISWCDSNKTETIETNLIFQLTLAKICNDKNIHLTILGSGGIFINDKYYTEKDDGNFNLNFYSQCRNYLEAILKHYTNVLYLRINYPISKHKSDKNLLTKLLSFNKIEDVCFSITYIDDLFPKIIDMIYNSECGICNFVNNGCISPVTIMNTYNKYSYHKFEISEPSNKSYSKLEVGMLCKYNILDVSEAIEKCVREYIIANKSNEIM
jgi:3,5-epimerase/4-reductase